MTIDHLMDEIRVLSAAERKHLIMLIAGTLDETHVQPVSKRVAGLNAHLGQGYMSEDFDDPLPDTFWVGDK